MIIQKQNVSINNFNMPLLLQRYDYSKKRFLQKALFFKKVNLFLGYCSKLNYHVNNTMKAEDSEVKQNFYKANRTKWRFTNMIYFMFKKKKPRIHIVKCLLGHSRPDTLCPITNMIAKKIQSQGFHHLWCN